MVDLRETKALVFDWAVLSLRTLEQEFFAASVLDSYFPSLVVVPLDRVFDDFCSQLVFQVEADLEALCEAGLIYLRNLGASWNVNVFNYSLEDQIWEVHVNLRNDLFCFEVIDGEPEMLSVDVSIWTFHYLRENKWSLDAVVVLKLHSLVEDSPSLILSNHFTFVVCGNGSRDFEWEKLNARLLGTDHAIGVRIKHRYCRNSRQEVFPTTRK